MAQLPLPSSRISALPPVVNLSINAAVAVVNNGVTSRTSVGEIVKLAGEVPQIDIINVESGEELDILIAEPGTYFFKEGSILKNGPTATVRYMYSARVTVYVKGESVSLTAFCRMEESSAYQRFGQWEWAKAPAYWSNVGAEGRSNPAAGKNFLMMPYPQA